MPRGVLVAGVPVGGLPTAEAERQLRAQIEPRATQPVAVTAGEARSEIDPTGGRAERRLAGHPGPGRRASR